MLFPNQTEHKKRERERVKYKYEWYFGGKPLPERTLDHKTSTKFQIKRTHLILMPRGAIVLILIFISHRYDYTIYGLFVAYLKLMAQNWKTFAFSVQHLQYCFVWNSSYVIIIRMNFMTSSICLAGLSLIWFRIATYGLNVYIWNGRR